MSWITTLTTTAKGFLSSYAVYVRWAVFIGGILVSSWATHHWDKGNEAQQVVVVQQQVIKGAQDAKSTQTSIHAMSNNAVSYSLSEHWTVR